MRIRFYKVECGDAASILYKGSDGNPHHIFIDSGYERTYRDILVTEIKSIINAGQQIDLWIISHIHDDHIGGAIGYIKAIEKTEIADAVVNWWHNHPKITDNIVPYDSNINHISEVKSFAQGERLTSFLLGRARSPNVDIVQSSEKENIFGLEIIVLSPTISALHRLRKKFIEINTNAINYHELTAISEPKSLKASDYHRLVDSFDRNSFTEDTSDENDSSITFLTEFNGKNILWLADAFPSTIINSLKKLGYSKNNPLCVDIVKVSHHGSSGNNSVELYNMIQCSKYVFCANGDNKYQLPTKECLVRILTSKNRPNNSFYELIFTHDNPLLRGIFDVDGHDIYERLGFKMVFSSGNWIDIDF